MEFILQSVPLQLADLSIDGLKKECRPWRIFEWLESVRPGIAKLKLAVSKQCVFGVAEQGFASAFVAGFHSRGVGLHVSAEALTEILMTPSVNWPSGGTLSDVQGFVYEDDDHHTPRTICPTHILQVRGQILRGPRLKRLVLPAYLAIAQPCLLEPLLEHLGRGQLPVLEMIEIRCNPTLLGKNRMLELELLCMRELGTPLLVQEGRMDKLQRSRSTWNRRL